METGSKQYLAFRVARKDLALDSSLVRAIIPIEEMTPIASTRPGVIGVVNVMGSAVVIVDLRVKLNLFAASQGSRRKIVVVQTGGGHLAGFIADRVADVIRYHSRDLKNGMWGVLDAPGVWWTSIESWKKTTLCGCGPLLNQAIFKIR